MSILYIMVKFYASFKNTFHPCFEKYDIIVLREVKNVQVFSKNGGGEYMDKQFKVFEGEYLEDLMNDRELLEKRPSMYDSATKYVEEYQRCAKLGLQTSEQDLAAIEAMFLQTFREKTRTKTDEQSYTRKFYESWPVVREHIRANPARAQYFRDYVVDSLSFYDAMRRILDNELTNATVMEAGFGVTYDIAGWYGMLERDDPSLLFDTYESILVFYRERIHYGKVALDDLLKKPLGRKPRVVSIGGGLAPEVRKYGFTLDQIRQMEYVIIDRELYRDELDQVFRYAHGVDFAQTGIKYIQDDFCNIAEDPHYENFAEYVSAWGVASYCESDDEAYNLLRNGLRVAKPGERFNFDIQIIDDYLKRIALIYNWSEKYPLRPEKSLESGLERWAHLISEAGGKIVERQIDSRNEQPAGVIFSITDASR